MDIYNLIDLNLGFITNIRGPQLIIIVLVILLLFGGSKRLPDMARGFGKAIKEFRKSAFEVEKDFRSAMDETSEVPGKERQTPLEGISRTAESTEGKTQI